MGVGVPAWTCGVVLGVPAVAMRRIISAVDVDGAMTRRHAGALSRARAARASVLMVAASVAFFDARLRQRVVDTRQIYKTERAPRQQNGIHGVRP